MTADETRVPTYADHDVDVARARALAAVEHLAASVREAADAAARRAAAAPTHSAAAAVPAGPPPGAWELSPDDWWDRLTDARKRSVQHWLDPPPAPAPPIRGQLDALDHLTQHETEET